MTPAATLALALLAAQPLATPLQRAIELYWNGEYQQTLSALSDDALATLRDGDHHEGRKYRAFSLIALGRNDEARVEFGALLAVDPAHRLDESLVSPKVLEQFQQARAETAEQLFQRGKSSYQAGEYAAALSALEAALVLEPASELAREYRELVVARIDLERTRADAALTATPTPTPAPQGPAQEAWDGALFQEGPPPAIHITGDVQEPVLVERKAPDYPATERRARHEGTVVLMLTIDRVGAVINARVVRSVSPGLDAAALRAVREWRYQPARLDGQTVAVYKVVTLRFSLGG